MSASPSPSPVADLPATDSGAATPGLGTSGDAEFSLVPGKPSEPVPYRSRMESAFGLDLGFVRAHTGVEGAMRGLGARAAARGHEIAFAERRPSPWLVAHELTHVFQQSRTDSPVLRRKPTIAPARGDAEAEADRVATRVTAGERAGRIEARSGDVIRRFAPVHHQNATISGLSKTFSAQEIGAIYAANWERDFSQGAPVIANAVLAWIAVKNYAGYDPKDQKEVDEFKRRAEAFRASVQVLIETDLKELSLGKSLGDTTWFEHMDAPTAPLKTPNVTDARLRRLADIRWRKKNDGLAGYILDARAHIKEHMSAAVEVYRLANNKKPALGRGIGDPWSSGEKPAGHISPSVGMKAGTVRSTLPVGYDDGRVVPRDPIMEQTARLAQESGASLDVHHDPERWRAVAQHLGRAMHAFEDFWSHSNWLELAYLELARKKDDPPVDVPLKTGSFPMASQAHALGHKLVALAETLQADFALLQKVYGQQGPSTKLDEYAARSQRSTIWGNDFSASPTNSSDHGLAYSPLENAWTVPTEMLDVAYVGNNVEELVASGHYTMFDFLGNRSWLDALAAKGRTLIAQGEGSSGPDTHGALAKDQPEEGKGHFGAMVLARAANELTFGPLRGIMDQQDASRAQAALKEQLALVDRMIAAPSPEHPLWRYLGQAFSADVWGE